MSTFLHKSIFANLQNIFQMYENFNYLELMLMLMLIVMSLEKSV